KKQPRLDRFGDPLPSDAVARLGTVRLRHVGLCNRVAYSPDGKLLASCGGDNVGRIWEADTGKERHCCVGHTEFPTSLACAPDGKILAAGGTDNTIRIWDARTGKEVRQLKCNTIVCSIALAPDGKTLASCGDDKRVHLWDPATGKELRTLEGHNGRIHCL